MWYSTKSSRGYCIDICMYRYYHFYMDFTWDENKKTINIEKHGIDFIDAKEALFDPKKIIINDKKYTR